MRRDPPSVPSSRFPHRGSSTKSGQRAYGTSSPTFGMCPKERSRRSCPRCLQTVRFPAPQRSICSGGTSKLAHADKVRNIGIIAHIDAGKTTLTERILFYAGVSHRMGEVHDGDSQMDYLPQERERGITITAAVTQFPWLDAEVHLVDTPGHVDFTIEVERSLRVLDGAVVVFCGVGGVEPQSEVVWRQADRHRIPRLAFVNKLDRPGADYDRVIGEMGKKLSARGVPVTAPLGAEETFPAVADLVAMEKVEFSAADQGTSVTRSALSPEEAAQVSAYRETLLEAAADVDDGVAEKYLSGEDIPPDAIRRALRKGTLAARFFPVFAGSALRNKGVQPVMDGIVHFLPSPAEVPPATGDDPRTGVPVAREPVIAAPFAALVFKVMIEEGRRTVYVRVYSGKVSEGDVLGNASTGEEEKVARLFRIHAGKKGRIWEAVAGDIVAIRGIRNARTGDTLCDPAAPILLESIEIRKPVVSIVVEPKTLRDLDRLREMVAKMVEED
ncbi:MAG: GTP-binding protein, partial [Deltaproteobacteria bacterium]